MHGGNLTPQLPLAQGTTKGAPRYGDWPDKKDSGGKETRMLEWLKEILGESYTEEIDKKVSAEIGRGFVAKVDFDAKNTELKTLKGQLNEANQKIQTFEGMDIEAVRREAADWKKKAEEAKRSAADQVAAVRFDAQLDAAISKAKGRSAKAIKALLDLDALRASKDPDKEIGAALEQLAKESGYLFDTGNPPPPYAGGTGGTPLGGNPDAALRAAFGLPAQGK